MLRLLSGLLLALPCYSLHTNCKRGDSLYSGKFSSDILRDPADESDIINFSQYKGNVSLLVNVAGF